MDAAYNGGNFTDAYGTVFALPAGSAAIGVLPVGRPPHASDKWKFSNIDGQGASVLNATTGAYDFYVEQSFQWRNKDICVTGSGTVHATPCVSGETLVTKPTTQQQDFINTFVAASGNPANLGGATPSIPGVASLPSLYDPTLYPAGQVMKGTRQANTCSPSVLYY